MEDRRIWNRTFVPHGLLNDGQRHDLSGLDLRYGKNKGQPVSQIAADGENLQKLRLMQEAVLAGILRRISEMQLLRSFFCDSIAEQVGFRISLQDT